MKQALKSVGLNTQALYNISSPVACQKDKLVYLVKLNADKYVQICARDGAPNDPALSHAIQNAKRAGSVNQFESLCEH